MQKLLVVWFRRYVMGVASSLLGRTGIEACTWAVESAVKEQITFGINLYGFVLVFL